jgi:predicted transcriptional regulator of viral defense system
MVGYSFGTPIYVTDVERTLLDALRFPDKSGGVAKVLQAWRSAGAVDLDKLIGYADAYDNQVLRQRVGYILDQLGRRHPQLDA